MLTYPLCNEDTNSISGGWFVEQVLSNGLVIVLQISLLIHGVFKTIKPMPSQSRRLWIAYLVLILVGLCWTLGDFFHYVIDPHTLILQDNVGCDIVAYLPKLSPFLYYGLYLSQILLRLQLSFEDSYLAMSKCTVYLLKVRIRLKPFANTKLYFICEGASGCFCVQLHVCFLCGSPAPNLYRFMETI